MEQYIIKGGQSACWRSGDRWSEECSTGIIAAAIMTDETILIENCT